MSVDGAGNQSKGDSWLPAGNFQVSADGRYVAFQSMANNLIAGDTGWRDVLIALGPAVLFFDGFEGGDTSNWSATSP